MEIELELVQAASPVIAIHGGAGTPAYGPERAATVTAGLEAALAAGWEVLASGGRAVEAAAAAVASMETSERFNAGRGAIPTTAGTVELDAAVMDGASGAAAGICAATWPDNPVLTALALADSVGAGALERARTGQLVEMPLLLDSVSADAFARRAGLAARAVHGGPARAPLSPNGTVGAVALDRAGHVAAATSTGGRHGQPPGRVGDTPIVGAGTWAEDRTAAVSGTGIGEAFMLSGFGHRVAWCRERGDALDAAVRDGLDEVVRWGGDGGAVAVTPQGQVVLAFNTPRMARGWRTAERSATALDRATASA
jgi:isoaspartyl peptidase/L-asparaginase-like protein (Ntn-hydrolase superfamily)